MKRILVALVVLFASVPMYSQQMPQFSQYMVNNYLINPAIAGTEDFVDLKVGYRNQWANSFGGTAPKTMYLTGHTAIGKPHNYYHHIHEKSNWHGVGGLIMSDKTGPTSSNSFYASYAYNMGLKKPKGSGIYKKGGIRGSFGMFAGLRQFNVDFSQLNTADPEAFFPNAQLNKLLPDASVGAWVYGDNFYVGASSMQLFANTVRYPGVQWPQQVPDANAETSAIGRLKQHYFITGGYSFKMNQDLNWVPSLLVKGLGAAPLSVDINSRFDYLKKYWAGFSYRHRDAVTVMVGGVINNMIEVAYSFDFTTSEIQNNRFDGGRISGAHEVIVGFRIIPHDHLRIAENHWK